MSAINITNARKELYNLVEEVNLYSEPTLIVSKKGNAVLVSENDWNAIQETVYLNSIPGMVESIKKGMETPIEDCVSEKDVDQKCEEIRNFLKDYYANINGELENIRDLESAEHNLKVAINWYINNQKNDKANANMKVFRKLLDTERKHFYEPNIIRELDKKNRNSVTRYMEELSIKRKGLKL